MKSEPKAFASLSSGLLARKGAARPAMRPQGFGQGGAGLEDLGWNDMGFEPPKAAIAPIRDDSHDAFGAEIEEQPLRNPVAGLTPIQSPVHSQQAEIAERFSDASDEEVGEEADDTAELYDEAEAYEPEREAPAFVAEVEVAPVPVAAPVEPGTPFVARAAAPVRTGGPKPRSAAGAKGKAAFTLRLDAERHLKLRLACAVGGRSAQMLVTDALDALLAAMPELDAMAAKANRKG